jgi:hypothetical protein
MTRAQAIRKMRQWCEEEMKLCFWTTHAEAAEYATVCTLVLGKPYHIQVIGMTKFVVRPTQWEMDK